MEPAYSSGSPYLGSQSQHDGHAGGFVEIGAVLPLVFVAVGVTKIVVVVFAVGVSTRVVLDVGSAILVTVKVDIEVTVRKSVIVVVGGGTTAVLVVPSYSSV